MCNICISLANGKLLFPISTLFDRNLKSFHLWKVQNLPEPHRFLVAWYFNYQLGQSSFIDTHTFSHNSDCFEENFHHIISSITISIHNS